MHFIVYSDISEYIYSGIWGHFVRNWCFALLSTSCVISFALLVLRTLLALPAAGKCAVIGASHVSGAVPLLIDKN
jgi:hypothetical protein